MNNVIPINKDQKIYSGIKLIGTLSPRGKRWVAVLPSGHALGPYDRKVAEMTLKLNAMVPTELMP